MALSDREKRLLEEMEAALASDDPSLESRLSGSTLSGSNSGTALPLISCLPSLSYPTAEGRRHLSLATAGRALEPARFRPAVASTSLQFNPGQMVRVFLRPKVASI
jgi:hypothetical protein